MKMSKNDMINYAAIFVIVISLASIGMQLTGYATVTDTAVVNVTVLSSAALNFTTSFVDFGEGVVNGGQSGAHLYSNGTVVEGNWTGATADYFVLENIGNVNLSLNFSADVDADSFLGGTSPEFQYRVVDTTEPGSCTGNNAASYQDFTTTAASAVNACPVFPFTDSTDTVSLDIHLYIPSDSNVGELTATITATGEY